MTLLPKIQGESSKFMEMTSTAAPDETKPFAPSDSMFADLARATGPEDASDLNRRTTPRPPNAAEVAALMPYPSSRPTLDRVKCREEGDILPIIDDHFSQEEDAWHILTAFVNHLPGPGRQNLIRLLFNEDAKAGDAGLRLIAQDLEQKVLVPLKIAHYPKLHLQNPAHNPAHNLRDTILPRDNYRCVFTHTIDSRSLSAGKVDRPPWDDKDYPNPIPPRDSDIYVRRIMPSMALLDLWGMGGKDNQNNDEDEKKYEERKANMDLIELCFPGLKKKCAAGMANKPGNMLSVLDKVGNMLGYFAVGLQKREEPHTYNITIFRAFEKQTIDGKDLPSLFPRDLVCFQDNTDIPLPDPELLEVHMSIGNILEDSRKGKAIHRALKMWWNEEGRNGGQEGKALEGVLKKMDERKQLTLRFSDA